VNYGTKKKAARSRKARGTRGKIFAPRVCGFFLASVAASYFSGDWLLSGSSTATLGLGIGGQRIQQTTCG